MSKPLSYVEEIAVYLGRVVGAQPGSLMWHGIVGVLKEVVERCAERAARGEDPTHSAELVRELAEERG